MTSARRTPVSHVSVRPIGPFRLDLTAWALRRRAGNAIDRWDGETYRRVIVIGRRPTELAVRQAGSPLVPRLIVTTTPALRQPSESQYVRSTVERLLGSNIDLRGWYRMADADRRLRSLATRFKGMKPPRFPTMFESLVNGFACQQLSLVVGLELLNRLSILCDVRRGTGAHAGYAFPAAHDVAALPASRYQAIGFSRQKVRALLELARGTEQGDIDLTALADGDDHVVRSRLLTLRGVGRWTADYVMLRGLGRLNVFPGDDVGAQKSLARWLGRTDPLDYAGVSRVVAKWQPYAGLIYFHLLLDGLAQSGALECASRRVTV
jgi:DNA-3-methyladenine glycosylase II